MATMLQLVQQATAEMGLPVPTYVAGNTAADTTQQLALLNAVGYELQREFEWQAITKEYTFTTQYFQYTGTVTSGSTTVSSMSSVVSLDTTFQVTGTGIPNSTFISSVGGSSVVLTNAATASAVGTTLTFGKVKYSLPSDYDRQVNRTHFDRSRRWEMLGPTTAQQWQWLKSSYISTGPRVRYRILGNLFQIWPLMSVNDTMVFEYVSNAWVNAGVKTSFTLDADTCVFPDRLMVLGLKKKYFEIKGFDATAFTREWLSELDKAKAMDMGAPILSLAPRTANVLIGWENIPDSGMGGVTN